MTPPTESQRARAEEVRRQALEAAYHGTGWNIARVTEELDIRFAQALAEEREAELKANLERLYDKAPKCLTQEQRVGWWAAYEALKERQR